MAQWNDGLKAIDEAVIENAESHKITPEEHKNFVRIQIEDDSSVISNPTELKTQMNRRNSSSGIA